MELQNYGASAFNSFDRCCIDTLDLIEYYKSGWIYQFVLKSIVKAA